MEGKFFGEEADIQLGKNSKIKYRKQINDKHAIRTLKQYLLDPVTATGNGSLQT